MKIKFFLNIFAYILIFFISSIINKQFNLVLFKITSILFFLGFSVFISLKLYPFKIKSFYSIEYKNMIYIFTAFLTPIICFISIISVSIYKGYLNQFSFERINISSNILSSIYVAITEELFFRGLIFYYLFRKSKNFLLAAIVSSLIFTLFHSLGMPIIENYPIFIFYFTSGIIMCYLMILSDSLLSCFLFHFTNNLLNKLVDFDFGLYEKFINQSSPIIFFPYIVPLIILLIYLRIKQKKSDLFL